MAAGPREKFHVALSVECTNVAAFGARNCTGARIYAHDICMSDYAVFWSARDAPVRQRNCDSEGYRVSWI